MCLAWGFFLTEPILKSTDLIFSFSLNTFAEIILLCAALILSFFLYVIFVTLMQDWKFILPIIIVAGILPIILISTPSGYVLAVGIIALLLLETLLLITKLKTYITFSAPVLLTPSIKTMITFSLLIISIAFYLSINSEITKNGFRLPDSLIDTAINFASPQQINLDQETQPQPQIPKLTPEQIGQIKASPELLKQFGLDAQSFDELVNPNKAKSGAGIESTDLTATLTKKLIQDQVQSAIKPYQRIVPIFLAVFLFLILQPVAAILSIFLSPLLWLTFYLFEKTKFSRFQTEMREIKKLVV